MSRADNRINNYKNKNVVIGENRNRTNKWMFLDKSYEDEVKLAKKMGRKRK